MSKVFYDHLITEVFITASKDADISSLEDVIKKTAKDTEEREELWRLVDEIIHHKVFDLILGKLQHHHHHDFLEKFHASPHDENLIDYLKEKIGNNIESLIKQEIGDLGKSLLEELRQKQN